MAPNTEPIHLHARSRKHNPENNLILLNRILKLKQENIELKSKALIDPLTGLPNRIIWDYEVSRLSNSRNPVISIIIDLDGLKETNDHDPDHHTAGDNRIKNLADFLSTSFRGNDVIACRQGERSDEFGALLEITNPEANITEIITNINSHLTENQPALNFSFGIAVASQGSSLPEAIKIADKTMYENKNARKVKKV